jgi:hypothetical protein
MKDPKGKDENAKNPKWKTPMQLPGVKPGDYQAPLNPGSDTQTAAGDEESARRLARQKGLSG